MRTRFLKRAPIALGIVIAIAGLALGATAPVNTITWSWNAPTAFTSGIAIPSTDTITYNLYIGTAGSLSEAATPALAGITADTVTTSGYVSGATVCGEVTAVVNGEESARSVEACKQFPLVPNPPGNVTAK